MRGALCEAGIETCLTCRYKFKKHVKPCLMGQIGAGDCAELRSDHWAHAGNNLGNCEVGWGTFQ